MPHTLRDVTDLLDRLHPPSWAESWDAVGLVCGDPDAPVRRVLLAVDPVAETVAEAVSGGYDLLVTHHPLYLRGTTSVGAHTPKGRLVHDLIRAGCGLFVAHTNADVAEPGVSDALAEAIGLTGLRPLQPLPDGPLDCLVVHVPEESEVALLDALAAAGAGRLGRYDACSSSSPSTGRFRPLEGASPAVGAVGRAEVVAERRVEVVLPRSDRARVVAAMRAAHPYEEPAYSVVALEGLPGRRGLGRVGELPEPLTLAQLVERVAQALPATAGGVRATAGGRVADELVRTVAVCGGAGDSLLREAAASGAQAYVTADLRHHPALEAPPGLALLDAAHWATEHPFLAGLAQRLVALAAESPTASVTGDLVVDVSQTCTDPWTLRSARA